MSVSTSTFVCMSIYVSIYLYIYHLSFIHLSSIYLSIIYLSSIYSSVYPNTTCCDTGNSLLFYCFIQKSLDTNGFLELDIWLVPLKINFKCYFSLIEYNLIFNSHQWIVAAILDSRALNFEIIVQFHISIIRFMITECNDQVVEFTHNCITVVKTSVFTGKSQLYQPFSHSFHIGFSCELHGWSRHHIYFCVLGL